MNHDINAIIDQRITEQLNAIRSEFVLKSDLRRLVGDAPATTATTPAKFLASTARRNRTTTTRKSLIEVIKDHGGSMLSSAARKESRLAKPRFDKEVKQLLATGAVERKGTRGSAQLVLRQANGTVTAAN